MQEASTSAVVTAPSDDTTVEGFIDDSNQTSSQNQISTLSQTKTQSVPQNTLFDRPINENFDDSPNNDQNFVSDVATSAQSGPSSIDDETEHKTEHQLLTPQPIFSYSNMHTGELEQIFQKSLPNSRRDSIQDDTRDDNDQNQILGQIQQSPQTNIIQASVLAHALAQAQQHRQPNDNDRGQIQPRIQQNQQPSIIQAPLEAPVPSQVQQNLELNVQRNNYDSDGNDCLMIGDIVPRPLHSTAKGLVKYEQDKISGNIPYIITVNTLTFFNVSYSVS